MADMMQFPKRWEDFLHDYEFEDDRRIYTNGSRLIPSFRVKQMMEHYAPVRHGRWICKYYPMYGTTDITCSCCQETLVIEGCCEGTNEEPLWGLENFCPNCGAKMDGGKTDA